MPHPWLTEYKLLQVECLHFWYVVGVDNNCPTWYDFCLLLWPFLPLWSPSLTKIQTYWSSSLFEHTKFVPAPGSLHLLFPLSGRLYSKIFTLAGSLSPFRNLLKYHLFKRRESQRTGQQIVNLRVCVPEIKVFISGVTTMHSPITPISCALFLWAHCHWLPSCFLACGAQPPWDGCQHAKDYQALNMLSKQGPPLIASEEWHFSPGMYPDTQTLTIIL